VYKFFHFITCSIFRKDLDVFTEVSNPVPDNLVELALVADNVFRAADVTHNSLRVNHSINNLPDVDTLDHIPPNLDTSAHLDSGADHYIPSHEVISLVDPYNLGDACVEAISSSLLNIPAQVPSILEVALSCF
jgi:hypothetical protein